MSHWLDEYWRGAQPFLPFVVLRWVVAALTGLGAAALFQWWGEVLGRAVRSGPAGWLDRGAGVGIGALVGAATSALAVMASILLLQPRSLSDHVARARVAEPMMATAAETCSLLGRYLPAGGWLTKRFQQAHRRTQDATGAARRANS